MQGVRGPNPLSSTPGQRLSSPSSIRESAKGLVDAVVAPEELAEVAARALEVLGGRRELPQVAEPPADDHIKDAPARASRRRRRGEAFLRRLGAVLEAELGALLRSAPAVRYGQRRRRYRRLGLV